MADTVGAPENFSQVKRKKPGMLLPSIGIFALSFAVYLNALSCGFVYDDMAQVLENPWIMDFRTIPDMFVRSVSGFVIGSAPVNYYRPFMHLIYLITYHLFGLTPWGFHLVNLIFHAANSVIVFLISARMLSPVRGGAPPLSGSRFNIHDSRVPALLAALLFATHPVHTEAVAWVAGLPDLSCTFFSLLSFFFYLKSGDGPPRKVYNLLSVSSFFAATFCKEPALTLPVILVLYDYLYRRDRGGILRAVKRYLPYVLVSGCYLALRLYALGDVTPVRAYPDLSTWQLVINVFPLFAQYLKTLFLPINLNVWHTFHPITSMLAAKGIISLLVAGAFSGLAYFALRKSPAAFMGLVFLLVPLLPSFYIAGIVGKPFAERYLYLPSFGFVFLCAVLVDRAGAGGLRRTLLVISLLTAAGIFSFATVNRNWIWKDNYSLFLDAAEKSPDAFIPRAALANALFEKKRIDEAIGQYEIALSLLAREPADPVVTSAALSNLGAAFFRKGLIDQAIEQYSLAIAALPDNSEAHANLGVAFAEKGWPGKAIEEYLTALRLRPRSALREADIHNNLGVAYWKTGRADQAREEFSAALRFNPENTAAANNLQRMGDPNKDHAPD